MKYMSNEERFIQYTKIVLMVIALIGGGIYLFTK